MKKKILISAAVAGLTLAPALTFVTSCSKKEKITEAHILSINDFHGAAPGYGDDYFDLTNINNPGAIRLASEFEEIRSKHPGTLTIACGDLNAGEGFSTCQKGDTFYPVLKALGITYSTVGNHAWEWGAEPLEYYHYDSLARTSDTVGNYFFTSNVLYGPQYRKKTWCVDPESYAFKPDYELWKEVRAKWADPFKLVDMNGHKVCLIGLTTQDTLTDGNIEETPKLTFMDYNASVVYSKAYCYELIGEDEFNKIDAFILDTHLSCKPNDTKKPFEGVSGEAAALAKNATTRIDGILAAHSHAICSGIVHNDKLNNDIPVAQGGQAARRYVNTTLTFNDKKKKGQRLQSVKMDVVTPKIDGIENPKKPDVEKARAQIENIVKNTSSTLVKNVAKVYNEQKAIAKANLDGKLGTLAPTKFTHSGVDKYGLPYWYSEDKKNFGTEFFQSATLLEPAGAWASLAMVVAFNEEFKQKIEEGKFYPAAIGFTNLDSIKTGFYTDENVTKDVIKKDLFQMHAFENAINYGCLTPYQLKQYINYFLAGDGTNGFDYVQKRKYVVPGQEYEFYYDDAKQEPIIWDEGEGTDYINDKWTTKGTSYCSGPNQFHGMKFSVKKSAQPTGKDTAGNDLYHYTLDETKDIYIYDPTDSSQDPLLPSTWTETINQVAAKFGGYIPIIFADYTWQGGNAQNRCLHHWINYNAKKNPMCGYQQTNLYTRNSAFNYIEWLAKKHPGYAVNQVGDSAYMDDTYMGNVLKINQ